MFDITPPIVSKYGVKKERYAVNIQERISLRNKSPSAKHTVYWLLVCVFKACPVVLKLQKELSGKLYTVNRNKTISERTEYEAILTLDCYVYRVHASNSIISTKSLSTPILYSHIKQYGHHRVVVLMETAVVLHGGVLYEGIELYMLWSYKMVRRATDLTRRFSRIPEYYPHRSVTITRHQSGNLHTECAKIGCVTRV